MERQAGGCLTTDEVLCFFGLAAGSTNQLDYPLIYLATRCLTLLKVCMLNIFTVLVRTRLASRHIATDHLDSIRPQIYAKNTHPPQ